MYGDLLKRLKGPFLYAAAKGGRLEECETLIELGANLNYRKEESNGEYEDEYSPLLIATRNGHLDIVNLLLANGADLNLLTKEGNSALHVSSSIGDENLCSLFLEHNCSPYALNLQGKTPIDIANEKGFVELGNWLKNAVECNDAETSRITNSSLEVINSHYGQDNSNTGYRLSDISLSISSSIRRMKTPDLYNGLFDSSLTENTESDYNRANEENESKSSQVSETSDENNSCVDDDYVLQNDDTESSDDGSQSNDCSNTKCRNRIQITRKLARKAEASLASSESIRHKLQNEYDTIQNILDTLLGKNLQGKAMNELEEIEKQLMESLRLVKQEKEKVTQELLQNEEKKHVCIICQSEPKCVLLMPCRHMCVCKHCSRHEELRRCPLCRQIILQKIDVYS